MARDSPQPKVLGSGSLRALSPLFWLLVILTGIGAGLAGGLLMMLLHAVQHLAWTYRPGDNFLEATEHASFLRLLLVASCNCHRATANGSYRHHWSGKRSVRERPEVVIMTSSWTAEL